MGVIALLQAPFFPPVAVAVLALVYFVLRPGSQGGAADPDRPAGECQEDQEIKKLLGRAIEAKRRGEHFKAGWLFESGSLWVKAAECYQSGGDDLWAAVLFARGNDHKRSAELYRRYGYPVEAAQALERAGQLGDAGVCYTIAGDLAKAAALFQKADRHEQAAELYFRLGMYHQAGRLFETAGAISRAADSYEEMLDSLGRKTLKAEIRIAKILETEQRIDSAIRFLEALGEVLGALFVAMRHDHEEAALRLYREYREILAGPLLRGVEDDEYPAEPLGVLFEKAEDYVPAARIAKRLGQMRRAAGLFERAHKDIQAGESWEAAGEAREAALAYERAGEDERAAPLFERAGDMVRAVHCYRQAGYTFEAGMLYKQLEEIDNAISSFQQVERSHPSWAEARLELARLVQGKARWDLAIDMYLEVLSERESTREDIDDLGSLASCLERRDRFGEAGACWRTIARLDPSREGVENSYSRLRELAKQNDQEIPEPFPYKPKAESAGGPGGPETEGFLDTHAADGLVMGGDSGGLTGLAAAGVMGGGGGMPAGLSAAPTLAGIDGGGDVPQGQGGGIGEQAPSRLGDLYGMRAPTAVGESARAGAAAGASEGPGATADSIESVVTDELDVDIAGFGPSGEGSPATESITQESPAPDSTTLESPTMSSTFDGPAGDALVSFEMHVGAGQQDQTSATLPVGVGGGATVSVESVEKARGQMGETLGVGDVEPAGPKSIDGVDQDATATLEARAGEVAAAVSGAAGDSPLAAFAIFAGFDAAGAATLVGCMDARTAAPGEGVLVGDDANDGLVLLTRGNVEVFYGGGDTRLAVAPALFGQEMLLTGDLPDIRARARTEARFHIISRRGARELADSDRALATKLAKILRNVPPLG